MKTLILAAMLVGGVAVGANAQSFTFSGTSTAVNQLSVTPSDGKPVTAGFSRSQYDEKFADGKTLSATNNCAAHSAMPGGIFEVLGACTFTDGDGTGSVLFGCNPSKDMKSTDCWGGVWGTGGGYQGKNGTVSWHQTTTAPGSAFTGVGQWDD